MTGVQTCALPIYDKVYLDFINDQYLPRANYKRSCGLSEYLNRTPSVGESDRKVTEYYRLFLSRRMNHLAERSLQPAIFPEGVSHVHTILSLIFENNFIFEYLEFYILNRPSPG